MNRNHTSCKSLDALGDDERVQEITAMRDANPGGRGGTTWYTLAPKSGWTCDPCGAHAAVEDSVRAIIKAGASIVPCLCQECARFRPLEVGDTVDVVSVADDGHWSGHWGQVVLVNEEDDEYHVGGGSIGHQVTPMFGRADLRARPFVRKSIKDVLSMFPAGTPAGDAGRKLPIVILVAVLALFASAASAQEWNASGSTAPTATQVARCWHQATDGFVHPSWCARMQQERQKANVRGVRPALWALSGAFAADAVTTNIALARGGRELLLPSQNRAALTAMVMGESLAVQFLVKAIARQHPKAAKVIAWIAVGERGAAVVHNVRVLQAQGRTR